jgi:hypothetical protein
MASRWLTSLAFLAAITSSSFAAAQLPAEKTLTLIDRTFICPEDLPNDEARDAANTLFLHLVMSMGEATPAQLVEFRMRMLRAHNCVKTLEIISKQQ